MAVLTQALRSASPEWPVRDLVYICIMGPVMTAAFVEWFLYLAAFLYCLVKVYQKAEEWSSKILALMMMIVFTGMRLIFLPVMIVTLPLPKQITRYFPPALTSALSWFAFYTFAGLLTIPFLVCIFQTIIKTVGRKRMVKVTLDEHSAPKTVVVMPVYKEDPDVLMVAIDSVIDCEYPASCLHVFLSFDGDQEDELYLKTLEGLGIPLTAPSYPRSMDHIYKEARITISKFPHGGKRKCQKQTFKLIDKIYEQYLKRHDNLFILFIDSDCILDKVCIQNFMYEMELRFTSDPELLAMTGVITSTTRKNTFITLLQDMEYIHGQLFERVVESACGSVTCLPGALTMLRFSAFRKMAKYYFADKAEQCNDLFDYGKCHLGEDRWLTHLFMIGAQQRYQIQMCTTAFCKTEAVQTFKSLLKQRRRWFLGYITNEACMLTDVRLWRRYTILCLVRLAQGTIRTTALLFFVMVVSVLSGEQNLNNLPLGFIGISLGLNWLMMIYFGTKLNRYKIWLYPIMFIANPFFNWIYMVYGIFTAGQRTWGGPRADAGAANAHTTPQQVIEKAAETGDDLNVVPETFGPAVLTRHPTRRVGVPLQPSEHLEGRFAPASLHGGVFQQANDSGITFPNTLARDPDSPAPFLVSESRRGSWGSLATNTDENRVQMLRLVDSVVNPQPARAPRSRRRLSRSRPPMQAQTSPPSQSGGDRRDTSPRQQPSATSPPNVPMRRPSYDAPPVPSRRSSFGQTLNLLESSETPPTTSDTAMPPYARWRVSRPSPLGQLPINALADEAENDLELQLLPPPMVEVANPPASRADEESLASNRQSGRKKLQKKRTE